MKGHTSKSLTNAKDSHYLCATCLSHVIRRITTLSGYELKIVGCGEVAESCHVLLSGITPLGRIFHISLDMVRRSEAFHMLKTFSSLFSRFFRAASEVDLFNRCRNLCARRFTCLHMSTHAIHMQSATDTRRLI